MQRLEGHTIREFNLNEDTETLTIVTDKSTFTYQPEGDCCAHAYLIAPKQSDINDIINKKVISVTSYIVDSQEESEWNVIDTEFYSIKTQFADLDLELRTEHNGYYCGWLLFVSEIPHES
jgi:hypothetical protein